MHLGLALEKEVVGIDTVSHDAAKKSVAYGIPRTAHLSF